MPNLYFLRPFLALALLLLTTSASLAAKRVALVIGNAAYKETAPLVNTRNDAADMIAALKRLEFDVLEGIDLDKRGMERLIRGFEKKLAGSEIALFFYAGHGLQISGRNFLVPTDARLAAEGDVDFESLPLQLVLSRMEREAKTSVVLLDACRDNPLARNLARTMGTRSVSVGQGLAEVRTGIGTLISFSTQPGNVALDGIGRNSPYTTALLKEIEQPGRDILTTLAAVRGSVLKATNGKQVPWEHTSLLGPLVLKVGPPSMPAPLGVPESAAARDWQAVKDTSNASVLESYLRQHGGDAVYAALATDRIEALRHQQEAAAREEAEAAAKKQAAADAAAKRKAETEARAKADAERQKQAVKQREAAKLAEEQAARKREDDATRQRLAALAPGARSAVNIAPVIGAPAEVTEALMSTMRTALSEKGLRVHAQAQLSLRGYFVAARDGGQVKLSYIWDVTDPSGRRVHRLSGEELLSSKGGDPWASVNGAAIQHVSAKTAGALASWLADLN